MLKIEAEALQKMIDSQELLDRKVQEAKLAQFGPVNTNQSQTTLKSTKTTSGLQFKSSTLFYTTKNKNKLYLEKLNVKSLSKKS